jgi:hypothetical protein
MATITTTLDTTTRRLSVQCDGHDVPAHSVAISEPAADGNFDCTVLMPAGP